MESFEHLDANVPKAWPDAVRLAFGFLDVDRDGFLSASDLLAHVAGEDGGNGWKWGEMIIRDLLGQWDKRLGQLFGIRYFSREN